MIKNKNIWIINHYAGNVPEGDAPVSAGRRHFIFAEKLRKRGFMPVVFCSNAKHNAYGYFHEFKGLYKMEYVKSIDVLFAYVKSRDYIGNGVKRVLNMVDFYRNIIKVGEKCAQEQGAPSIIYASSAHPLSLIAGIKLARRFNVKCVCEVRDLWPESIVAYGFASASNPIIKLLYKIEKRIYEKADAIIFTMEGGIDYLHEKRWTQQEEGNIDTSKVYHINNGVDLLKHNENLTKFNYDSPIIEDKKIFKAIYTGSIRRANNIDKVIDAAQLLKDTNVHFLIFGEGNERNMLSERCKRGSIHNVHFMGPVEKKYIPSILSKADVNFFILEDSDLFRFGLSVNKSFEYLASGKPMIIFGKSSYSMIDCYRCGIHVNSSSIEDFASAIVEIKNLSKHEYHDMCVNARKAAEEYDYNVLTDKLIRVMEDTK